jgi:hypothetical protein
MNMKNFEKSNEKNIANVIREHMGEAKNELTINISDYIAILSVLSKTKLSSEVQEEKVSKEIEDTIKIYVYLRDKYHAKTGYEALEMIRKGEVDERIIAVWIEEKMVDADIIHDAVKTGYPELIN